MNSVNKKKVISGVLVCALSVVILGNVSYFKANASSDTLSAIARIHNLRNNTLTKTINIHKDKNEKVRAIVVLEDESVASSVSGDIAEYNSELKSKEEDIIEEQASIIKKVERITDSKVVNQSAFLVNSFSIDATREDMGEIAEVKGVKNVYEASTFKLQMTDAVRIGKVNNVWESDETGYTGEGTVVAVIDTGVNYIHKDMVLDKDVKTKYTKEQWEEKIKLIGHGKYCSDKVPFGYDYVTGEDECLNTKSFHGYHVAGIVGANGKVVGAAKNAQILGIKVLGNNEVGTTDDLVKGIEDSVKLGADIINMSLGYECSVISDEDYLQEAINKANEEGVLCCIAACNDGTSAAAGDNKNIVGIIDTATVGSPAVAKGSLCVASVDNIKEEESDEDDIEELNEDDTEDNTQEKDENGNISIDPKKNVNMSVFSSWGPTNELNIKPEISAPGGNINSLYDGTTSYIEQSGTSMATPFTAGSQALVLNAIKAKGYELEKDELTLFMKSTLMNTADVIIEQSTGNPYSVRYQGAGLIDVEAAVKNNVLALCNNEPKVELGEIDGNRTVDITLKNYSDKDASYNVDSAPLYTNYIEKETGNYYIVPISDSSISFSNSIVTVPAKGSITVTATVNIANVDNESFVEGFILFKGNDVEDIGMPLLGFYGDWSKESIIDSSVYEDENSVFNNEYNLTKNTSSTGLVGVGDGKIDTYLGLDNGICNGYTSSFSPNGDNIRDSVAPIVAAIRSPKEVKVRVLDSEKNVVREVATCTNLKKLHSYSTRDYIKPSVMRSAINSEIIAWDGMLYNSETGKEEIAPDGEYYIELVSKINDTGREQNIVMPVKVDTDKPAFSELDINKNGVESEITFKLEDNIAVSPYVYVDVNKDGKVNTKVYKYGKDLTQNSDGSYTVKLSNIIDSNVTVMWEDEAGNEVLITIDKSGKLEHIDNKGNVIKNDSIHEDDNANNEDNVDDDQDKVRPYVKIIKNDDMDKLVNCPMVGKYLLLIKEEKSREITFDVQVNDDNLDEDSFSIVAGTVTVTDDNYSTFVNNYSKTAISYSYKGDGVYNVHLVIDDDEEEVFISVADKAGNVTLKGIQLFNSESEDNYNRRLGVNGLMYKVNLDNAILTDDMLNEDGTYIVKGMLNVIPEALILNGKNVTVDDETMEFEEKIQIEKGCNKVNFSIVNGMSQKDVFTNLYYDDIKIDIDGVEDEVVHVSSDEFDIKGVISSHISIGKIDINGQNIYTGVNGVVAQDGDMFTKEFTHKVKLTKGENIIQIKITNFVGHITKKAIHIMY